MENKNSSRRHFLRELGFVSGAFAAGTLVGAKAQANGSAIAQEDLSCVNCQFTVDESKTLVSGGYIYKYTLNYTYFCVGGASGYGTGSRKLDRLILNMMWMMVL